MAYTDSSILAADIAAIETEFGAAATVTWRGTSYVCTLDVTTKNDAPSIGGFMASYKGRAYIRSSLFSGTKPNSGDEITIDGKTYAVDAIDTDPDGVGAWYSFKEVYG